jgi:DNA-binding MarR family transcriptional regulator
MKNMNRELRSLHRTLVDIAGVMNQPQRDTALLREAGVSLDRALFPLLVAVERKGPVGVGEVADLVGRDYTTVSRQMARLEALGLVERRVAENDSRVREALVTAAGQRMTSAIDAARERMAAVLFSEWSRKDVRDLARLMRRFADDLHALPLRVEP